MAPFWQNARAFCNCRIQNRCINSDFYQFKSDLWCLDKDFCMAAFAYVYEIFTVTQLQFAVTKSNKKFTEQACGRFCFQSFIHLYEMYFLNLSPLLRTDRTCQWIKFKFNLMKQNYISKKFIESYFFSPDLWNST